MRAVTYFSLIVFAFAALVFSPAVTTGQGKKSRGGGGGFGGFDAGAFFDRLSNGKPTIAVSEMRTSRREELMQFIKDRGITNGQITRQQYVEFMESMMKARAAAQAGGGGPGIGPMGNPPGGGKGFGGFGGKKGGFGQGGGEFGGGDFGKGKFGKGNDRDRSSNDAFNPDAINERADSEFRRRDRNGDQRLNKDEMSDSLRASVQRWDANGDGLIDQSEYRNYYTDRVLDRDKSGKGVANVIIQEDELDRKPVVFRAGGSMPSNLPAWFKELDYDADGQVALWEWRKGAKPLEDYAAWDLNNDAFITPQEALRQQTILAADSASKKGIGSLAGADGQNGERGKKKFGGMFQGGGMFPGGGTPPGGGGFRGGKQGGTGGTPPGGGFQGFKGFGKKKGR